MIPRKSFARKMVRLSGWTSDAAIAEIAHVDGVPLEEAEKRYNAAIKETMNRSSGQKRRHEKAKDRMFEARIEALVIAYQHGKFLCSRDLPTISALAGWGASVGVDSTGRAYREIVSQLEKEGLFSDLYEEGRFVGYVLTDQGRKIVNGW